MPQLAGTALRAKLASAAAQLGAQAMGVAAAGPLHRDYGRLRAWLDRGFHGQMEYMARYAEQRSDPRSEGVAPFAKSVIVLAFPYGPRQKPPAVDKESATLLAGASPAGAHAGTVGPAPARIARYAWGKDYHNVLGRRLRKLVRFLESEGYTARPAVDTKPVMERAWAVSSGVGFVGKNTCLIVPGLGSHVFLSVILTDAELPTNEPIPEGCGSCRACLDVCPTDAFKEARVLDARRCISYLTIEHRGEIPTSLRSAMGAWAFGCDDCQDVCPYNHGKGMAASNKAVALQNDATPEFRPAQDEAFGIHARWEAYDAETVLNMTRAEFDAYAQGTPLKRPGYEGMRRNLAIVLGNTGDKRHLRVLSDLAEAETNQATRDAARWAASRITSRTQR